MLKPIAILSLAVVAAAGCMTYLGDESHAAQPPSQFERDQRRMAQLLDGKVPGPPQGCIQNYEADRMSTIGDDIILFRTSSSLVYRNDIPGGCPMSGSSRRLQRRTIGGNLCRGEPMQVIDNQTGAFFGTCILGDFVPYRRP
jgi:hypothetical protein